MEIPISTCPVCEEEFPCLLIEFYNSTHPFCSEKCRLIDMGLAHRVDASTQKPAEKLPLPRMHISRYGKKVFEETKVNKNGHADPMVYYDGDEEGVVDREQIFPPLSSNGTDMSKQLDTEMPMLIRRAVIQTKQIMSRSTQKGTNCEDGDKQSIGHFITCLRRNIEALHCDVADYDVQKFLIKQLCKPGQWMFPGEVSSAISILRHPTYQFNATRVQMWAMNSATALSEDEETIAEINSALDCVMQSVPVLNMQLDNLREMKDQSNEILVELCQVLDDSEDVLPEVEDAINNLP